MVVKNKISKKKVKKISLRKSKTNKTTTKRSKKKSRKVSKKKIKQNIKKSYRKKKIRRSSTKKKKVKKTTQKKKKVRVVNKKYLKKLRISRVKSKRKRGLRVYTKKRRQKNKQKGGSEFLVEDDWFSSTDVTPTDLEDAHSVIESWNDPAMSSVKHEIVSQLEIKDVSKITWPKDIPSIDSAIKSIYPTDEFDKFDVIMDSFFNVVKEREETLEKALDNIIAWDEAVSAASAGIDANNPVIKVFEEDLYAYLNNLSNFDVFSFPDINVISDWVRTSSDEDDPIILNFKQAWTNIHPSPYLVHNFGNYPGITYSIIYDWWINKIILLLTAERYWEEPQSTEEDKEIFPILDEVNDYIQSVPGPGLENIQYGGAIKNVYNKVNIQRGGAMVLSRPNYLTNTWDSSYPPNVVPAAPPPLYPHALLKNNTHYISHLQRFGTYHDFRHGMRGALALVISAILPRTYRYVRKYLNVGLFTGSDDGARNKLLNIGVTPTKSGWEKILREYTFKFYSDHMIFITFSCKDKTPTEIYNELLRKYNFGLILEEERLNKSGDLLGSVDHSYKIAKLLGTKALGIDIFGSLPCWYDPGSGTATQMITFYNYVSGNLSTLSTHRIDITPLLTTLITMPGDALYGIKDNVDIQLRQRQPGNPNRVINVSNIKSVVPQLGLALIFNPNRDSGGSNILCGFVHKVSVNIIFQLMILICLLRNSKTPNLLSSFMSDVVAARNYSWELEDLLASYRSREKGLIVFISVLTNSDEKIETIQTILVLFSHIAALVVASGSPLDEDILVAKCIKILLILKRAGDYGQLLGLHNFKLEAQKILKVYKTVPNPDPTIIEVLNKLANPTFESMDNALISAAHSIGMSTLSKNIENELEELKYGINKQHWQDSNSQLTILEAIAYDFTKMIEEKEKVAGVAPTLQNLQPTPVFAAKYIVSFQKFDILKNTMISGEVANAAQMKASAARTKEAFYKIMNEHFLEILKNMANYLNIMKICVKIYLAPPGAAADTSAGVTAESILNKFTEEVEAAWATLTAGGSSRQDINKICINIRNLIRELLKIKDIKNISFYDSDTINKTVNLYKELSIATNEDIQNPLVQYDKSQCEKIKNQFKVIKSRVEYLFSAYSSRRVSNVKEEWLEHLEDITIVPIGERDVTA